MKTFSQYIFERAQKDTKTELKKFLPTVIAFLNTIKNSEDVAYKKMYDKYKEDIESLEKTINDIAEFKKDGTVSKLHMGGDKDFDTIKSNIEARQNKIKSALEEENKQSQETIANKKDDFAEVINKDDAWKKQFEELLKEWLDKLNVLKEKFGEDNINYTSELNTYKKVQANIATTITSGMFKDAQLDDLLKNMSRIKTAHVTAIDALLTQEEKTEETIDSAEEDNQEREDENNKKNDEEKTEPEKQEEKIAESDLIGKLAEGVENIEGLADQVNKLLTDEMKNDIKQNEYVGANIMTLGAVILHNKDKEKTKEHIEGIIQVKPEEQNN